MSPDVEIRREPVLPDTMLPELALPAEVAVATARSYQCPGETYSIDRPVHLFRLANCYPACQACPHREDTAPLPRRLVRRQAETQRRGVINPLFTSEAAAGVALNQLTAQVAYRLGQALGVIGQRDLSPQPSLPQLVIASDGRPQAAEVLAAAAEGLRWSGCQLIDIGTSTAAGLAWAIEQSQANGGLLVANPLHGPHTVGVQFWHPGPLPCSSPGALDAIAQLWREGCTRPTRHGGQVRRADFEPSYLDRLRPYFHAMRPLRIVLSTDGHPLVRGLDQLRKTVRAAIHLLPGPSRAPTGAARTDPSALALAEVRREVLARQAHFGIWMDSVGELCRVVDERGDCVSPAKLLGILIRQLGVKQQAARPAQVLAAAGFTADELAPVVERGFEVTTTPNSRAGMSAALRASRAALGVDPLGRCWFPGNPGAADGLELLALLMTSLSQSDRPLSEVAARWD